MSPSMRREWIEIGEVMYSIKRGTSPSMRREWIEMKETVCRAVTEEVSLHAEGVD